MAAQVRPKEFRFPVGVAWDGDRRATGRVAGKPAVPIATPPVFRGTDPETWSPEDAFVLAASSCLAVTVAALAERQHLPLHNLSIEADGIVGRRDDGRFGFVRIEQTVELETDAEHEMALRALVAEAEDGCLVTASLALPVLTNVVVRTPSAAAR